MVKEDERLLKEFLKGDEKAFSMIVEKYEGKLLNFFYKMCRDSELAKDFTQEVFLRFINGAKNLRGESSIGTWLFRVATNILIDNKRKFTPPKIDIEESDASVSSKAEYLIERRELKDEILKAIKKLPEAQQNALMLFYYEGNSLEEISEILNCSLQNVKNHLFRAKKNLAQILKEGKNGV